MAVFAVVECGVAVIKLNAPCGGITHVRFYGYDLSKPEKPASTPGLNM
jgi:hypothetical protein